MEYLPGDYIAGTTAKRAYNLRAPAEILPPGTGTLLPLHCGGLSAHIT